MGLDLDLALRLQGQVLRMEWISFPHYPTQSDGRLFVGMHQDALIVAGGANFNPGLGIGESLA